MGEGVGPYNCSQTNLLFIFKSGEHRGGGKPCLTQELFPEEVIMSQDPEVKKVAEDSSGEHDTLGT